MSHSSASGARPRPVGDAPVAELVAETEALAKGWLLTVLGEAPLTELPARFHPSLPVDGPRLCAAVARALASDAELSGLAPGGELEPVAARAGALVGAEGPEATLRAVAALGTVIWSAVRAERPRADGEEVAQLAERLAAVLETVRRAALRGAGSEPAGAPEAVPAPEPAPAPEAEPVPRPEPVHHNGAPEPDAPPAPHPAPVASADLGPASPRGSVAAPDPGTILWRRALADEVDAAGHSGAALSLLLIELEDAERLAAAEPADEVARIVGHFTQAIRSIVRRQDLLARESESRMWLIARDTARLGAEALGRRAVTAVAESVPWHGTPLGAAVGVAVLGEDAREAAGLIEAAEQACFAAAASGAGLGVIEDD